MSRLMIQLELDTPFEAHISLADASTCATCASSGDKRATAQGR